ncbi:MAG TPA: four helix bundle protein [Verrucomicrobiae bacterium]|jgi:four helix bundle protein
MSYRNLEIWKLARTVSIDIHKMTLSQLPKFELYETGSQIRRSSKSVRANIVEGYGRRHYKQEFLKFLMYSHSSCDETVDHLETLFETSSLADEAMFHDLSAQLDLLGRKISKFIDSVEAGHRSEK